MTLAILVPVSWRRTIVRFSALRLQKFSSASGPGFSPLSSGVSDSEFKMACAHVDPATVTSGGGERWLAGRSQHKVA